MNRFVRLHLISLLFAVAPVAGGHAQDETLHDLMPPPPATSPQKAGIHASIRLFDSLLIHPLPDWSPREVESDPLSATRFDRQRGENIIRQEMVPVEETFKDWRNLYGLMGLRNYPGTNAAHAGQIVRLFRTGCSPSNINIQPLHGNERMALQVVACGSFSRQPDIGEVAVFVLLKRGTTAARLYREWRGPAFRAEDPGQWPVKRNTLRHVIMTMTGARLVSDDAQGKSRP